MQINNEILTLHSATDRFRSMSDLRDYGQRLLATFPDPGATDLSRIKVPLEPISPSQAEFERDGDGLAGCGEAVEIVTRNPKKGRLFRDQFRLGAIESGDTSVVRREQGRGQSGGAYISQIGIPAW